MTGPGFRLRYDEMREGNPTTPESAEGAASAAAGDGKAFVPFATPGHIRNLELVWPDGKRAFRNYSYLSGGEMTTDGDLNTIALYFSSDTVFIKGYGLASLFAALLDQTARQVIIADPRYKDLREDGEAMVKEIIYSLVL